MLLQSAVPAAAVQGPLLLVYAAVAVVALVVLIARYKLNPFVTLVLVSLILGIVVGMPMSTVVKSFETGVGNTLGHIALVVALGTMLGKMMAESGGAEQIAHTLIRAFGEKRVHWAMATVAFIVGIPVFFEVGFVLLVPIAFTVAKRTGTSMLFVGIPTAALAGPVFGKLVSRYVVPDPNNPLMEEMVEQGKPRDLPGFGITLFTILLPVALMLLGGWADVFTPKGSMANDLVRLAGNSVVALLIALLVSFWTLGAA